MSDDLFCFFRTYNLSDGLGPVEFNYAARSLATLLDAIKSDPGIMGGKRKFTVLTPRAVRCSIEGEDFEGKLIGEMHDGNIIRLFDNEATLARDLIVSVLKRRTDDLNKKLALLEKE